MRLVLDIEGADSVASLPGDGAALVAFMSFAVMRGFGAQHSLIALADHLDRGKTVRLGPLTTFYERTPADIEDREKLEMAWQDPAELHESLVALVAAVGDGLAATLLRRGGGEELPGQAEALLPHLGQAAKDGKRVRLVYDL